VKYLGFIFSSEGIRIDENRIDSINNLKYPKNINEVQKFLGVVNYLRNFIENLAELTAPLRDLLKKETHFQWNDNLSKCVDTIKSKICEATTLLPFDPTLPILIQTDASQHGLGACLIQNKKKIAFASRALSEREIRYSQIEKELLSVIFGLRKFHNWIFGNKILVQNDHKPLSTLIKKDIHKVPSGKLQRMIINLWNYDINFEWVPGKYMHLADFLSRNFIESGNSLEDRDFTETVLLVHCTEDSQNELKINTENDEELKILIKYCLDGFPIRKQNFCKSVQKYFKIRDSITFENGILFHNDKIIVPTAMRSKILNLLHESHFGISKTKARARSLVFWFGMTKDIENKISQCEICQTFQNKIQKEPMISLEYPLIPWFTLASDIGEFDGKYFLVTIDYFSKWIEFKQIPNKSANSVISVWSEIFATHGYPKTMVADNNPFFII